MKRNLHIAVAIACAVAILHLGASAAFATGTHNVFINGPAAPGTTLTSGNPKIRVNTALGQRTVICQTLTIQATISNVGVVGIANGAVAFAGCLLAGTPIAITQTAAWTGQLRHLDDALMRVAKFTLDIVIPNPGLSVAILGCAFILRGTQLGDHTLPAPVFHGVLVNIGTMRFPASLPVNGLTLIVQGTTAMCAVLGIANGNAAQLNADFGVVPAINGRG